VRVVRRDEALVPFTVLVAFLLAAGRWGSYLGLPEHNIFVTDIGLVVTAVWLAVRHSGRFAPARLRPLWPLGALVVWVAIRFVTGGHFDVTAVRDVAPYVYVLVALGAGFTVASYRPTVLVVEVALLVHLVWVRVTLLASEWTNSLPLLGGKVRVLELRPDFDGACIAVLACLAAVEATRSSHGRWVRIAAVLVSVGSALTILQLGSRSGILALGVGLLVLAMTRLHVLRLLRRPLVIVAVVLVAGMLAVVIPHTYAFDRWTADPRQRSDAGSGTIDARQRAWSAVIDDTAENPTRLLVGSGFGPDFLKRSGAAVEFERRPEKGVRAPHNYVLNTFARLGLVGVALLGLCIAMLGRATFRRRRRSDGPGWHQFSELTVLIIGALGVTSLVGVILEGPFGAVPFWWAAGWLLAGTGTRTPELEVHDSDGSAQPSVNAAP
jgi:O-antigen ligase